MPIQYVKRFTRELLRSKPDELFVFGDNLERAGLGGQARECRGEPNAIGIATKRTAYHFMSDCREDFDAVVRDLSYLQFRINQGAVVNVPLDGIGTGLAQLPTRAPLIYRAIVKFFHIQTEGCPWPLPE